MKANANSAWNLESFLDSLILELDKAQDTLAIKGLNRKLTYTVKDISLDMQIFPEFDGETVRFTTAKAGDSGASKITFQLGSIRDNQIREIAKESLGRDHVALETVALPEEERKELKRLGIDSVEDLQRTVEGRNIDLEKVTENKVDYKNLANLINQAHRKQKAPKVSRVSLSQAEGKTVLTLQGNNLAMASAVDGFPAAALNDQQVKVIAASDQEVQLEIDTDQLKGDAPRLQVALDPYAVLTMNLQAQNAREG